MTISATEVTGSSQQILASLSAKATTTTSSVDDQQSRFLKLLTTQLKNQDPLNPADSAQTTSQLAQISTVDGIERLNQTLGDMVTQFKSNESLQAAQLVGRQVLVEGSAMSLQQGLALGGVNLDSAADQVSVTVYDSNNLEVDRRDLGPMDAGSQMFVWDGTTTSGGTAVDGQYRFVVNATRGDAKVTTSALQMATVSSVVTGDGSLSIDLGPYGKAVLSDIKRIL